MMRPIPEFLLVDGARIAPDLAVQRRKAGEIDAPRPEQESVRPFEQIQLVARTDAESVQHRCGQLNLVLGRDLDYHEPPSFLVAML